MNFFRNLLGYFQLSPRTQRRLNRFGQTFFGWLAYPLHLVANLFREIGRLLVSWWSSRNIRFLLQGLPALLLAIGVLVFGVVVYSQDRNLLATHYQFEAGRALSKVSELERANRDTSIPLAMAETCTHRLSTLNPEDQDQRYSLAFVLIAQKKVEEAEAIMRLLAPSDQKGFGPAHLWLADRLLKTQPLTRDKVDAAIRHLERATTWKKHPDVAIHAHSALAQLYRNGNEEKLALEHQTKAADYSPEQRTVLAIWLYDDPVKRARAKNYAQSATVDFQKRLQENVDDHVARRHLITCAIMTGNYDLIKSHAQVGLTLTTDSGLQKIYQSAILNAMILEYEAKTIDNKWSPAERYAFLEFGLEKYPDDFNLLQRLVAFTRLDGAEGDKARKVFTELRSSGRSSAIANLISGSEAWQKDDLKQARYYWEQAFEATKGKQNDYAPLIANNLAWVLANYEPVDLDRAKDLIDEVIKKVDAPPFRSTRGFILARMGRHKEALPDLEAGKKVYFDDTRNGPTLFRQLAETCKALGLPQAAAEYKQHAEELEAKDAQQAGGGASFIGPPAPDKKPGTKPEPVPPAGTSTPDPKKPTDPPGGSGK